MIPCQQNRRSIIRALILCFIVSHCLPVSAQKNLINADSIWCDHLNEIIKCASTDIISDRICRVQDSDAIAPFVPVLNLTDSKQETMNKQYGKVTYTAICYTAAMPTETLTAQYEKWYRKVKKCLDLWAVARLDNEDKGLPDFKDYFITNDEDETTVRLDIVKTDKGYGVRLRIF